MHMTLVHEHDESGSGGQRRNWKITLLHADEWKGTGCKWSLDRRCVAARKNRTMTSSHCRRCEVRSKGRWSVGTESAQYAIKGFLATEKSDFAGKRGEVKTQQDRCNRVSDGELHRTPCDWEQLELWLWAEDRYELVHGFLVFAIWHGRRRQIHANLRLDL